MVRPSKTFLFDVLEKKLKTARGSVGIDAGSGDFKNHKMFKTDYYYGLDIDFVALQKGLEKFSGEKTLGFLADLTVLDKLPNDIADVVVCTNTLYAIPYELRLKAVTNLCGLVKNNGSIMLEFLIDESLDSVLNIIKKKFSKCQVLFYRNPISRFYEGIFEKNGYLGSHPVASKKPFRILSWCLSRIEFLTCKFKKINQHSFILAYGKREKGSDNTVDFPNLEKIGERLYNLR